LDGLVKAKLRSEPHTGPVDLLSEGIRRHQAEVDRLTAELEREEGG
jgi:hypothetical protein